MKLLANSYANQTVTSLLNTQNNLGKSVERLSTGLKINKSVDDVAGFARSNKLDAQIRALQQANRNVMDGISLIQTAEGAYDQTQSILQRMRELTVQAANGTNTEDDVATIELEINELSKELHSIQSQTSFNQVSLLDNPSSDMLIQSGAYGGDQFYIKKEVLDLSPITTLTDSLSYSDYDSIQTSLETIDEALSLASNNRSLLGSYQTRMEFNVNSLAKGEVNATSAYSRIVDADMAYELAEMTKYNVLNQSSMAILAQANQMPQQVLGLLAK